MADHINENLPARLPDDGTGHAVTQNHHQLGAARATPTFESLDEGSEGVPWGRYISALRRYKWLILAVAALGTTGAVVASRFIKPEFTVTATIWIQSPSERAGVQPGGLLKSYAWQELLGTNVVLDSVALGLRLYLTPQETADSAIFSGFGVVDRLTPGRYYLAVSPGGQSYDLINSAEDTLDSGAVGDSIGRHLGFRWAPDASLLPAGRNVEFTVVTPRDASSRLRTKMSTNMAREGNFLRLSLLGTEPRRLAEILNAITEQFVSVAAEQKARKLSLQARTLETQLDIASDNLDDAESRLQQYRIQTITLPSERTSGGLAAGLAETRQPVIDQFFERRMEQQELRQSISALETTVANFQLGGLGAAALLALNVTAYSPNLKASLEELAAAETELRELRRRFTDEAPLVITTQQRIAYLTEIAIPEYSDELLRALQDQESRLSVQIDAQAVELKEIPVRTITEQRLTREKVAAEKLVEMLQNSHEETKLALSSTIPDVRQLDPAMAPTRPSSNNAPRIIMMGFIASLGAGLALAILLDLLDKRFRYPEQASDELGLTILGAVPAIKKLKKGHRSPKEASQVIEAFRTVRLALSHSYGAAGPIMFTVSSPGPGDGKSLVSSNLALSFADAGYSTLLIDGDIRRGELHRMFDIDRQPGLLDYLTGETSMEDILREAQRGLSVVPCGTRRHLGPELLSSPAMGELMAALKTRFDVIILDSPPLGAGIDPFILSTTTGNLLMVLRSGETDRKMAEEKLKLVDRLPIRVLGALLNDVRTTDGAYKYYNYVYDYHPEEDAIVSLPVGAGNDRSRDRSPT
jgi:succinoglycan biosynthesis transport protein ExoP